MLALHGGGDLFKEIKSIRKTRQVVATSMDGVKDEIPNHFRNIYSSLYNSVEDTENLAEVAEQVENKVGDYSLQDVAMVTPNIVKEAATKLKPGKTDPVFSFSSDCIRVESDKLAETSFHHHPMLLTSCSCYEVPTPSNSSTYNQGQAGQH